MSKNIADALIAKVSQHLEYLKNLKPTEIKKLFKKLKMKNIFGIN